MALRAFWHSTVDMQEEADVELRAKKLEIVLPPCSHLWLDQLDFSFFLDENFSIFVPFVII